MKLIEAFKNKDIYFLRVSVGNRWLIFDHGLNLWVVHEHKYGTRKTIRIIETADEEAAVAALLEIE